MVNVHFYGDAPYAAALIHGGPGAAGELAPLAQRLAANGLSVLEPLQTADSVDGQIEELAKILAQFACTPATLLGYSWGAWLALLTAARYPEQVKKLILVSSAAWKSSMRKIHWKNGCNGWRPVRARKHSAC